MAKSNKYWDDRAIRRLTDAEKHSDAYIKRIQKMYDRANRNVQRDIESVYRNYSKATGLDVQSLKELLTASETSKLWEEMKSKGLDKYVKGNYKARISRLEKIQAQIYAKAKEVYPEEQLQHTMCYEGVINNSYYKAIYDAQMGTGFDFAFSKIDENMMSSLLSEPWSGKSYSQRIWGNTDILAESLAEIIGGALVSGQSIEKTSRQIRERFNVAKYYADRLVRTETNHFNNEADALAYEEMDVDKYVFLATLDTRTSTICQDLDHEVFPLKERQVGVNYPPMHPNCRSKTRAYMGEEIEATMKRRARNPVTGKTEIIDNMSYKEWAKQHSIGQPTAPKQPKAPKTTPQVPKQDGFKEITNAMDFQYGKYTDKDFYDWEDKYNELNKGVKLSADELENIEEYTEGHYIGMNAVSRGDTEQLKRLGYTDADVAKAKQRADALDDTLSKFDLDTDIVTHRFERDVSWLTGNGNSVEELEKLVGSEYTTDGFTSSGMFANRGRFTGGKADAVHFEIVTPKGTNGAYLSMSKKGETEFLYNRNTRFRVLDGGERIVKERKYNFNTGEFDLVDVKEHFLRVQAIPDEKAAKTAVKTAEKAVAKTPTRRNNVTISPNDLPAPFTANKKELENSSILCDYINGQANADPKVVKAYSLSGKIAKGKAKVKISHAGTKYGLDPDGRVLTIPKLSGVDDIGNIATAMHEDWHLIDFLAGDGTRDGMLSVTSEKLLKAVKATDDKIGAKVSDLFKSYNDAVDDLGDKLWRDKYSPMKKSLNDQYANGEITYKEYDKLWKKVDADYKKEFDAEGRKLMGGNINALQDIYDALSGGLHMHGGTLRYGHGINYYFGDDISKVSEIVANYGSLSISRPDLIDLLREDKPSLVSALDELMDTIISKYGG